LGIGRNIPAHAVVLTSGHDAELTASLGQHDSLDFVFAEVDAGGIAAEGHVEREFVQLSAYGQRRAFVGQQGRAVVVGTTGSGITKSGLKVALRTRTPAPPMVSVSESMVWSNSA
jgi:hypothetical protein